ncbi:MAG: YicC/YloC family endoribonuclease [Planctomycetota bacterium]
MINSMTGYGEAEGELGGVTYAVEIKTVNSRYFKSAVKLPEVVAFLEEDIERFLRQNLSRGSVNYVLRLKNVPANVLFDIDEPALRAYVERLGRIAALPGILVPVSPEEEAAEQIRDVVLKITQEAVDKLRQMRATEGAALAADLEENCEAIRQDLEQIRARYPVVLQEYRKKLQKRVDELLAEVKLRLDEESLAREVAIFAEKSDISEEIARLSSHLEQFTESHQANTQAGRRLEFISQEMFREANTIASKASDSEITRCVVDIKCRIDRIKEQVQNVE